MVTNPKKSKQIKASAVGGQVNNGLKKGNVLYIPRQVLMNDSTRIRRAASLPSKANTDNCSTTPSRISEMNDRLFSTETPKTNDQMWSPLMDGIVTSIPPHLIANCSLSNGTVASKDPKKVNVGLAIKALDEYIDEVLYGSEESKFFHYFPKRD